MFRTQVLIIRRSKLHYTASGIITRIGGRLVHELVKYWDKYTDMYGQKNVKKIETNVEIYYFIIM